MMNVNKDQTIANQDQIHPFHKSTKEKQNEPLFANKNGSVEDSSV